MSTLCNVGCSFFTYKWQPQVGWGEANRHSNRCPEAQGSPGVQALSRPRCPAVGPPLPYWTSGRQVGLFRESIASLERVWLVGRESQGAAERFLPLAGVFTHVRPRPPCRGCGPASQFRAGRGARLPAQCPVTGPPAEVVRGCGIRSAHKVSLEGLPRTESWWTR